jgi:hypothetical protein
MKKEIDLAKILRKLKTQTPFKAKDENIKKDDR